MNSRDFKNACHWIERREYQANSINRRFQRALHINPGFADRLGLVRELEGHNGCVNCLEWSQDGSLLVSGSDDFNIIVWEALKYRIGCRMNSGHSGNIFSVKFLPHSNNNTIASAAADAKVRLHSVNSRECTQVFGCHMHRVKRLAVSPHLPYMLWSGSEDGTVRQFDLRQPHSCSQNNRCANIIINLNTHVTTSSEAKCIAINPLRPELIAVGSSDPFTRIYDTRMLSLHSINDTKGKSNGRKVDEISPPPGCVSYFSPGHIPQRYGRDHAQNYRHYVVTYLSFSPDGQEILANLGGEHAYIFDIMNQREALKYSAGPICPPACEDIDRPQLEKDDTSNPRATTNIACNMTKASQILPERVLELKSMGNENFSKQNYFQAIVCYNLAIELSPCAAVLYANRAAALLKRGWEGDIYAALHDCHMALNLDPEHSKAHYRQVRCLYELQWYQEAMNCLNDFKYRFPEQAGGYSTKKLERDIRQLAVSDAEGTDENNRPSDSSASKRRRKKPHPAPSEAERLRQENAWDYKERFVGACNTTTDIKEAAFFGQRGQFVVAGSDCGCFFLWNRATTNLVEAWHGDESIVNCLQPHPSICMLATSGIDPVVRLWTPLNKEAGIGDWDKREKELGSLVRANQRRMNVDPLEVMLTNMGYRARFEERTGYSDDESSEGSTVQCRTH